MAETPSRLAVTDPAASDSATASLSERVRAVFLTPGRLAEHIRPGLPWLDVLLISTAVAVLAVAFVPDDVFVEPMREAVSRRGEPVEITSPPGVIANWGRWLGMMATLATHPVVAVALAGVLTLIFAVLLRGEGTFRDYLSLSCHALLIPALGTIVAILFRSLGPDALVEAIFTRSSEGISFASSALFAIDPFVVWMLIALAVAVRGIDRRRSALRASALLLGGYLLLVLASTALLHPELV